MADASCRRELELEIPAEEISKASEKVAKEFEKMPRVQGPAFADKAAVRGRHQRRSAAEPGSGDGGKGRCGTEAHSGLATSGGQAGIQRRSAGESPGFVRREAGVYAGELQDS